MKRPIIMRYVKQVSRWRKFVKNANRVWVCVSKNVFKKKNCGASPLNGETLISLVNNDMDRKMREWGWMKKA